MRVALGPACVFLLRSRGLGSARGGRRRRRDRRGAQLLGPGAQRGRRRRRRRRAKRPFATAVQWVNAGCLRWPFGGRPKPFDRRAAPLSSQRPGSWPLLYLRVSAKRRPKRLEPLTMRQKLSSASSRHGGALCYGHFGASLRQSLPSQFYPPPLKMEDETASACVVRPCGPCGSRLGPKYPHLSRGLRVARAQLPLSPSSEPLDARRRAPPPPRSQIKKHTFTRQDHCWRWSGFAAGAARPTAGSTEADRPICEIWLSV